MEFLCKIFGLQQFYFSNNKSRFSWITSVWSITLVTVAVTSCAWGVACDIMNRSTSSIVTKTTTAMVVTMSDIGTLALSSSTCVIMAAYHSHTTARVYSRLSNTAEKLNFKYSRVRQHKKIYLKYSWQAIVIITVFTVFLIIDFILAFLIQSRCLFYISVYILHYITFTAELQIAFIARKIKHLFLVLNAKISTYLERSIVKPYTVPNTLPPVEMIQGTQIQWLSDFGDVHWHLCSTIQDFNIAFGIQLVTLLLCIFAHVITTPYFFFLALTDPETYNGRGPYLYLKFAWILLYSGQLCLVVAPCAAATDKAGETATVLCKYLNMDLAHDVQKQTENFLLQLLHHDANFSAFGLFNINLPVITSVAGAVTTYLVILIQFQKSDTDDTPG